MVRMIVHATRDTAPARRARAAAPRLRLVERPALRVADVALFYGERSGGIRTYLDAKVRHLPAGGACEHHVIVPGPRERHAAGRHELPSLRMVAANGYRIPLGARALQRTLRAIRPDVVLLHDPFWGPLHVTQAAHRLGARVVAVHHGSSDLDAAGMPGPMWLWTPLFRAWLRHAYAPVDAVMSVVDPRRDCGRPATLPLLLGVETAYRPRAGVPRGDHTVYVGRLAREKGVFALLEAAAAAEDPWPLRFVGSGPAEGALRERARRMGLGRRVSFRPFVHDPERLALTYAGARCVVMPGEHETFGLVGLEAAASGARVVCCTTAPSGRALGDLADTFAPGDRVGLGAAITAARAADRRPHAAAALAARFAWPRLFAQELERLRELAA
jgi:alpha-1,6-mannosyltransferase